MSLDEKLKKLEELKREAEQGGGEERLEAQHGKGKLSARERLELLMDEGSFVVRHSPFHRVRPGRKKGPG